jgi:hypothetical protein
VAPPSDALSNEPSSLQKVSNGARSRKLHVGVALETIDELSRPPRWVFTPQLDERLGQLAVKPTRLTSGP